jgi:hypothetical protein
MGMSVTLDYDSVTTQSIADAHMEEKTSLRSLPA